MTITSIGQHADTEHIKQLGVHSLACYELDFSHERVFIGTFDEKLHYTAWRPRRIRAGEEFSLADATDIVGDIGFADISISPESLDIHHIEIAEDFRGNCYASTAIRFCEFYAREIRIPQVKLHEVHHGMFLRNPLRFEYRPSTNDSLVYQIR